MKTMKTVTKILLGVLGVLLAVVGILCLVSPTQAVSSAAWLVGLVLLISGIGTAIYYFVFGSFLLFAFPVLLNAIGDILFGVIFLQHPDGTSRVLTILFGLLLIGVGISAAFVAVLTRRFVENRAFFAGLLLFGVAAAALGIIALVSDTAGAILVAIPVGLILLGLGIGYIALDVHLIRSDKVGETPKYFKDVEN